MARTTDKAIGSAASPGADGQAIALREVAVTFRLVDGAGYPAVKSTSISVADGEFVAIVGPTGCGKSTLLNIAAGLIAPSAGHVNIFGTRLAGLTGRRAISSRRKRCFLGRARWRTLRSGLETAGIASKKRGRARKIGSIAWGWASFATATHICSRAGRESGWGLRRCSFGDPKILLMDEPIRSAGRADPPDHGQPSARPLESDRKAVLFVTHDLEEAIALSDRVVIMSAGPAAYVIDEWKVALARPRDIAEIKTERAFPGSAPRGLGCLEERSAQGLCPAWRRRQRGTIALTCRGRIHFHGKTGSRSDQYPIEPAMEKPHDCDAIPRFCRCRGAGLRLVRT